MPSVSYWGVVCGMRHSTKKIFIVFVPSVSYWGVVCGMRHSTKHFCNSALTQLLIAIPVSAQFFSQCCPVLSVGNTHNEKKGSLEFGWYI